MGWVYLLLENETLGFDATMSETHDNVAEVTEHPVEDGSKIADHVRIQPFSFSCEVYITNTPIVDIGRGSYQTFELQLPRYEPPPRVASLIDAAVDAIKDKILGPPPVLKIQPLVFGEPFDRVKETYDRLTGIQKAGTLMSVLTSVRTYENMILASVSLPRDEIGGARFNLDFKQIEIVQTETVAAPKPVEPRGAPGQKKGGQATKAVSGKDAVKSTSLALKAVKMLGITQ